MTADRLPCSCLSWLFHLFSKCVGRGSQVLACRIFHLAIEVRRLYFFGGRVHGIHGNGHVRFVHVLKEALDPVLSFSLVQQQHPDPTCRNVRRHGHVFEPIHGFEIARSTSPGGFVHGVQCRIQDELVQVVRGFVSLRLASASSLSPTIASCLEHAPWSTPAPPSRAVRRSFPPLRTSASRQWQSAVAPSLPPSSKQRPGSLPIQRDSLSVLSLSIVPFERAVSRVRSPEKRKDGKRGPTEGSEIRFGRAREPG